MAKKCKTKNSGFYTGVLCFGEIYMKIEDSKLIFQHLSLLTVYIILSVRESKRIVLCKLDEN